MLQRLAITAAVLVLVLGCARPVPESRSAIVTFKAGTIRLHDTAFVTQKGSEVEVTVYSAGEPVLEVSTGSMVCINGRCMSDDEFATEYLSPHYPPRIIGDILRKAPLDIDAKVEPLEEGGFKQNLYREGKYDIRYFVTKEKVLFKDLLNGIIIAVKDLSKGTQ